jgi:hypothetical protein
MPSRRHGWFWAGGFTAVVVFTFRAFFTGEFLRTTPLGSARHWSGWPRYTNCTPPLRNVRTITLRRTRFSASCCRFN